MSLTERASAPISAIVVNYNGEEYLDRCLTALLAQTPAPDEVLLVDNESTDGSLALVNDRFPSVHVIPAGGNKGPAFARNLGVERARNELCLVLDNDVVLHDGCIDALRDRLAQETRGVVVQARSFCGDRPDVVHYDSADIHFLGTLVLHNWFRPAADAEAPAGQVGAAIALCFLVRRTAYLEVGGFDPNLFILYEDNEFSYKLRMRGHTIHLEPRAHVTHLAGTAGLSVRNSEDDYSGRRTWLHSRNRYYVLLTCMRWRTLILTLPAQLAYGLVYAAFGHRRGHWKDWWHAKWALIKLIPTAVRGRRVAQRGRTVADRDLLVAQPLTLNPGLADRGFAAWLRRTMNRCFGAWWWLVRRLCG